MTAKVLLATAILFAPLILMCVLTIIVEASQKAAHRFDRFDAHVLGRLDKLVQR